MDLREGSRCAWCNCNLRSSVLGRALVQAINQRAGTTARGLKVAFSSTAAQHLRIAEINRAGNLHGALRRCVNLHYSEYGSTDPSVPSEDLNHLSFADACMDLVITSDTLEHVPDVDLALREVRRVLAPGGAHVFTVPMVFGRPTRRRAEIRDGMVVHLLPPSYHGDAYVGGEDLLVFTEFGDDFIERCRAAGFDVQMVSDTDNLAAHALIATRR